jgi:predicted nucleic acid-binding protein
VSVRVVVADTGPLHYLVLIGQIDLLPRLFAAVTVPTIVRDESLHPNTPQPVRDWMTDPPPWLTIATAPAHDDQTLQRLDAGESAAITLALALQADLMLMDDRAAVAVARARGLAVVGTIGILDLAGRRKLIDIVDAVARLKTTNFRYRPSLLDALLTGRGDRGGA